MTRRDTLAAGRSRPASAGWILYDGSCGFCRRWVLFWEGTLGRRGLVIAPLQTEWVAEKLKISGNEIAEDLRLLLSDGRYFQGADVYRYAMKRIWWAYPLYLFSVMPFLGSVFDTVYRTFANHRHQISRLCRLPGAG